MKKYILHYNNEKDYCKLEAGLKICNILAYNKLKSQYYPSLKNGKFDGKLIFQSKKTEIETYKLELPSDERFIAVHGKVELIYTVYKKEGVVMLDSITPKDILLADHMSELTTYKGIMIPRANASKDMFKIDLLNMLQDEYLNFKIKAGILIQYSGQENMVSIPNEVKRIGKTAFKDCQTLKILELPDELERIDEEAFSGCISLTTIEFPKNLKVICRNAFRNCKLLDKIKLPESMEKIGIGAFSDCESLKEVNIPEGIKKIENRTFINCKSLEKVNIPNSVEEIGSEAFLGCESLKEINIPKSVKKISNDAFNECTSLKEIDKEGCYVATCVYGSYDCPEVWTLRRYRDNTLAETWYGRVFIHIYYAISPTIVKLFGNTKWFEKIWRKKLDKLVNKLQSKGVKNTPYNDKVWK